MLPVFLFGEYKWPLCILNLNMDFNYYETY